MEVTFQLVDVYLNLTSFLSVVSTSLVTNADIDWFIYTGICFAHGMGNMSEPPDRWRDTLRPPANPEVNETKRCCLSSRGKVFEATYIGFHTTNPKTQRSLEQMSRSDRAVSTVEMKKQSLTRFLLDRQCHLHMINLSCSRNLQIRGSAAETHTLSPMLFANAYFEHGFLNINDRIRRSLEKKMRGFLRGLVLLLLDDVGRLSRTTCGPHRYHSLDGHQSLSMAPY